MYEQDKTMQYCFYIGVLVFFVFAICYFGRGGTDGTGSTDAGARIDDSQAINSELQAGTERIQQKVTISQGEIGDAIKRLGNAEAELASATSAIESCERILETAKRRTQEKGKEVK